MPRARATEAALTPAALKTMVDRKWGEGTMRFASDPSLVIERIPTGILSIDFVTSGGFPKNRYVELYGSATVGKTFTALHFIATAQALGYNCAFIDVEKSFDPEFAEAIGVDLPKLAFHHQRSGNQVIDFMETLLRSELFDVIVLDSIAGLLPMQELQSDMEAGSYGTAQAKLMSAALRRLTTANKKTSVVFINQQREAIGVSFGKRTTTPGGRAMSHYAGMRIEMVRTESLTRSQQAVDQKTGEVKEAKIVYGHRVLVRVEKNKTGGARPQEETTFVFDYDKGCHDHIEDLLYLGRHTGFVHKNSSDRWWVEGGEDEKIHGRRRFKTWLGRNVAIAEELEELIRDFTGEDPEEDAAEE